MSAPPTIYDILDWNQTIDSSNRIRPLFTFEPSPTFIAYLNENPGPILITLDGTTYYDGQRFATCLSTSHFPTFGPNYFEATRQYAMVVHTDFTLYPPQAGTMTVDFNVRTPTLGPCSLQTVSIESFDASRVEAPSSSSSSVKIGNRGCLILIASVALLVLLLATFFLYRTFVQDE